MFLFRKLYFFYKILFVNCKAVLIRNKIIRLKFIFTKFKIRFFNLIKKKINICEISFSIQKIKKSIFIFDL